MGEMVTSVHRTVPSAFMQVMSRFEPSLPYLLVLISCPHSFWISLHPSPYSGYLFFFSHPSSELESLCHAIIPSLRQPDISTRMAASFGQRPGWCFSPEPSTLTLSPKRMPLTVSLFNTPGSEILVSPCSLRTLTDPSSAPCLPSSGPKMCPSIPFGCLPS